MGKRWNKWGKFGESNFRSLFVLRLHARATLRARVRLYSLSLSLGRTTARARRAESSSGENRCGGGKRNLSRVLSDDNSAPPRRRSLGFRHHLTFPWKNPHLSSVPLTDPPVQCVTDRLQCSASISDGNIASSAALVNRNKTSIVSKVRTRASQVRNGHLCSPTLSSDLATLSLA